MINFQYVKASSAKGAINAILKDPKAQFIAGGTNLVDLMKRGVMTPERRREAAGIDAVISGFQLTTPDDQDKLRLTAPLYEALYAYCRRKLEQQPVRDGRARPTLRYRQRVEAHLSEDDTPPPAE